MNFAFLDSGIGGIPYLLHLKKIAHDATCAYLADTRNFPYGEKSDERINECAFRAVSLIVQAWHPETIVVACNTISVHALEMLRAQFQGIPIVGTVPAIKRAAEVTKNKRIGLLATNATIHDKYIAQLERDFASDCTIFARGDAALVSFIEEQMISATDAQKLDAVTPAVTYFKENGCDVIVLGCTHFTHMAHVVSAAAGAGVSVVDSRDGVARQAIKVHDERAKKAQTIFGAAADFLDDARDSMFFTTGFSHESDAEKYSAFCASVSMKWGGVLS
ncbi:MAG: glutamate racemase [Treponema sp.]|nr:glutamate racemase [Treponema sp.]